MLNSISSAQNYNLISAQQAKEPSQCTNTTLDNIINAVEDMYTPSPELISLLNMNQVNNVDNFCHSINGYYDGKIHSFEDFKAARTLDATKNPQKGISLKEEDLEKDFETFWKSRGCRNADDLKIIDGQYISDMASVFRYVEFTIEKTLGEAALRNPSLNYDTKSILNSIIANASPEDLKNYYQNGNGVGIRIDGLKELFTVTEVPDFEYYNEVLDKLAEQLAQEAILGYIDYNRYSENYFKIQIKNYNS